MNTLTVRITRIDNSTNDIPLPHYATQGAAGMDIYAAVENEIQILPGKSALVPTGFVVEVPIGYEAQIRPRSGLAIKHNIGIMNSPGTIDSDYRGEVKIILTNFGTESFTIKRGERIAQMVVAQYSRVQWNEVDKLTETSRGEGGFGHTGVEKNL